MSSRRKSEYEELKGLSAKVANLRRQGIPEDVAMKSVEQFSYQGELMDAKRKAWDNYQNEFNADIKKREDAHKVKIEGDLEDARRMIRGTTEESSMRIV